MMRQSLETFGKNVTETIKDEFSFIPYDYEERDGGAENVELNNYIDDGSIFTEIFDCVCGETIGSELNPPLTTLVSY